MTKERTPTGKRVELFNAVQKATEPRRYAKLLMRAYTSGKAEKKRQALLSERQAYFQAHSDDPIVREAASIYSAIPDAENAYPALLNKLPREHPLRKFQDRLVDLNSIKNLGRHIIELKNSRNQSK